MYAERKIFLLVLLFFTLFARSGRAQSFDSNSIYNISLLKSTLTINAGQFGFNSITISNLSGNVLNLGSKVELPRGWSLLRNFPSLTQLGPGESTVIPIRIKPGLHSYGGKKYPIKIIFENPITGQRDVSIFDVSVEANTHWMAKLIEPSKFTFDSESLPNFKFLIQNIGNRTEVFDVNFRSELRLTYPSSGFQLILKPGKDTLIDVGIRSRTLGQLNAEIQIDIAARDMRKQLTQKIFIISNQYKPRDNSYYRMPITLNWTGNNLANPAFMYQYLEADGYMQMRKDRAFSFRLRTPGINSDFNLRNNLIQLNYHTRRTDLTVGTLQDFMYKQLEGNGFRFDFRENRKVYEVFALKGRFIDNTIVGIRQEIKMPKNADIRTEGLYEKNHYSGIENVFGIHTYNKRYENGDYFSVRGGYSTEKASESIGQLNVGYGGGYTLSLHRNVLDLRSSIQYFSDFFPGVNRGTNNQTHQINFNLGKIKLGSFASKFYRKPNLYNVDFTESYSSFSMENTNYGFQAGLKLEGGTLFLKASEYRQLQYSETNPKVNGQKISLNYSFRSSRQEHVVSLTAHKSTFGAQDKEKQITSYSSFLSGKVKNIGYMSRFDYGPIYYFDYLFSAKTGRQSKRHQHSIFYDGSSNKNLRTRYSVNYFEMANGVASNLTIRNETFLDIPKPGINLNLMASIDLLDLKSPLQVGLSISKTLNAPIPFMKKYKTLTVAMFKDKNNNDIWDSDEEAVEGANVLVEDKYLVSNNKGEISLVNVDKKTYTIDYKAINNQAGWIPESILGDTIKLDKNKRVIIPFKNSKVILGKIDVDMAHYSLQKPPLLDGLKVMAVNKSGEIFYSITDKEGRFYFNLTEDIYTIQLSNNIFGSNFYFLKTSEKVDLRNSDKKNVGFTLREKERKVRVRQSTK